jgi:hypothetical protein
MTLSMSNEQRERVRNLRFFRGQISHEFATQASARKLLEPALFVKINDDAENKRLGCDVQVMEWLQLAAMVKKNTDSGFSLAECRNFADRDLDGITLVLVQGEGFDVYGVPDPRVKKNLRLWPWVNFDDDDDD